MLEDIVPNGLLAAVDELDMLHSNPDLVSQLLDAPITFSVGADLTDDAGPPPRLRVPGSAVRRPPSEPTIVVVDSDSD
jgi:hypothetical protein